MNVGNRKYSKGGFVDFPVREDSDLVITIDRVSKNKLVFRGIPEIKVVTGHPEFGDQMQLGFFVDKQVEMKREARANNKYDRIEINLDLEAGEKLLTRVLAYLDSKKTTGE